MHSHKQRYAKSIQQTGNFFGTTFGTKKKNNKKNTQAGGVGNQHLSLALSTLLQQNSQIFGTKTIMPKIFAALL